MFPLGSIKKLTEGLPIFTERHTGAASITPPTLQNSVMYSFQF